MEWAFKATFAVSETEAAAENVDLVFDGLDTFAVVELVSTLYDLKFVCNDWINLMDAVRTATKS